VQVRLLEKLLRDEVKSRMRSNRILAQRFGERVEEVSAPIRAQAADECGGRQTPGRDREGTPGTRAIATSNLASPRRRRLSTTRSQAGVEHVSADPDLAAIAHELVESIRKDLTVDWTDREATQAKVRTKIKRLLRRHRKELTNEGGGGGRLPISITTRI
jgi:type I restriction enzyme R subunit